MTPIRLLVAGPALAADVVILAVLAPAVLHGSVPLRSRYGWLAVALGLLVVAQAVIGRLTLAAATAGLLVWTTWLWWTHGGGDGTRRRLRRLRSRFAGVRRTAPAAAMAVGR